MLTLEIEWLGPSYEAGLEGSRNEWPPHPARVFCSLVASADPGGAHDEALRWLEDQPAPIIMHPRGEQSVLRSYVPTNATGRGKSDTSQQYVGRTNGERAWPRTLLSGPVARMLWPGAEPPPDVAESLGDLARRVPYLGRATSPALLSFGDNPQETDADVIAIEPATHGKQLLRAPYPGYLDELRLAFDNSQRAWTVGRSVRYAPVASVAQPKPEPVTVGPYPDMVALGFTPGSSIDGRHSLAVANAWKAAILQRLGTPLAEDPWEPFDHARLALVHGHHDGSRRQVAFLSLPVVGHRNADGHLVGVAVCLSADLDAGVRRAVLQLFGLDRVEGPRLGTLRVPGLARFDLHASDGRRTLDPDRWRRPSHDWASVLPIVPDRWPRPSMPVAEVVAEGCEMAGYPRPVEVELVPTSVVPGAPWVPHRSARRRPDAPSPRAVHAVFRFGTRVQGPVVVGHLRHLGLGLCLPMDRSNG